MGKESVAISAGINAGFKNLSVPCSFGVKEVIVKQAIDVD